MAKYLIFRNKFLHFRAKNFVKNVFHIYVFILDFIIIIREFVEIFP